MSNKLTLQAHNATINTNNNTIDELLTKINNLPDASDIDPAGIEEAFIKRSFTEYINDTITSIGNSAFRACANLEKVSFTKALTTGEYAFYDCAKLVEIDFPKATLVAAQSFRNCTSLTKVNLPVATNISNYGFYGDTALETIRLPQAKGLGLSAFNGCSNLKTVIIEQEDSICTLGSNVFANSGIVNATGYIYVPDSLVDSYKTATNWSTYAEQIKPLSELEG